MVYLPDVFLKCALKDGLDRKSDFRYASYVVRVVQVVPCSKQFVHDWKECSFAHEGETARRRHP